MITLKELNLVTSWASKAPYPGTQYADKTAEKLIQSVDAYEKFYKDKEYDLILSNGEQFEFEILSMNLCHMLGIEYKNLSSDYYSDFRKEILGIQGVPRSYELLKAIVDNIDEVLKYDKERSGVILNYYRVMVKCSIFEKISDFTKFDFGVINFDKNVYEQTVGDVYHGNAEKFLYVQSNEQACPYFMMGILPDRDRSSIVSTEDSIDVGSKYAVETLFAPTNVRDFFYNQNVAIPTQILTTTTETMDKKEASPSHKLALLNQYRAIVSEYDVPNNMDIYGDYIATLSSSERSSGPVLVKK